MGKIWDFFENLNDVVYVSDIETDEIIYMNRKALEVNSIPSMEDAKGKKCYEALKGAAQHCAICNKDKLSVGNFEEWIYFEPNTQKGYKIRDTLVEEDGKIYRLEFAMDINDAIRTDDNGEHSSSHELIINEGLRIALAEETPEQSIETLMEYIGRAFSCDRVYIFEPKENDFYANTYEWCSKNAIPQKEFLQECGPEVIKIWLDEFKNKNNIIIKDLEDTKETDPAMYEYLLPQDIHSLVVSPLIFTNRIIGFYGVDNPPEEKLDNISTLFQILGHFLVALLRRRDLFKNWMHLSFYDELTGFGNRHAMDSFTASLQQQDSIGVVYCDVNGLKRVNDEEGHKAGDALLIRACGCIKRTFEGYSMFRIGGDEFLVLCGGINENGLQEKLQQLNEDMAEHSVKMAIGHVWRPDSRENIDKLLAEADRYMYESKKKYYEDTQMNRRRR